MKKILSLLLAVMLLSTLAAPAMALELVANGEFTVDVNLEVPENPDDLGSFVITIPDFVNVQYGVADMSLPYSISVDRERFAFGRKVGMDITSEYFREWTNEDEEGTITDFGYELANIEQEDGVNYRLYRKDGWPISGAPYGWEDRDHILDNYDRFVEEIRFMGDNDYTDGAVRLHVDYPYDRTMAPGNYYSSLTFHVFTGWAFRYDEIPEGYEYVIKEGYENRVATDWDDDTAAFDPDGWPNEECIDGFRQKVSE